MKLRKILVICLAVGGVFLWSFQGVRAAVVPPDLTMCPDPTAAHSVRATVAAAMVGDRATFSVEPTFDYANRTQTTATLRAVGTHSLIYVEDTYYASLSSAGQSTLLSGVTDLQQQFDSVIYPGLTSFYGFPWEPGIDGDVRVTILLTHLLQNAGGYFDTRDEYSHIQAPGSNEREMIYLNAIYAGQQQRFRAFAAHEFTHVINFNQKDRLHGVEEEVWLNELRADYAPTYVGYETPYAGSNLSSRVSAFLSSPQDSLTEWTNSAADYGMDDVFAQYLAGHYGEQVIGATMKLSTIGIASIDAALAAHGIQDRFADAFQNFEIANFVNGTQAGTAYAYTQSYLSASTLKVANPTTTVTVNPLMTTTVTRQIKDWSGQWITVFFNGSDQGNIIVTASSSTPIFAKAYLMKQDGTAEVRSLSGSSTSATLTLTPESAYRELIIVPTLSGKTSGFSTGSASANYSEEPLRTYNVVIQRTAVTGLNISSANPSQVLVSGGAMVALSGSGFTSGTVSASLDGQALAVTVVNDTTMRFTAPSHAAGNACLHINVGSASADHCDFLSYVSFPDGSLLRGENSPEVWIVQGNFRRHIVRGDIFSFYPHLSWNALHVVPDDLVTQYRLSAWVRLPMTQDPATWRIYEVNDDATRHWITCADADHCGTTWLAHGGDPAGVYTINQQELSFYAESARVFLQ